MLFGQARNAVEDVKESMGDISQGMADPRVHIDGFGKLIEVRPRPSSFPTPQLTDEDARAQVSVIHRRFVQALEMVTSLRGMYDRLSYISDLLDADRAAPLSPSPNLLPIHYHLAELETFRNETLAQAKRGHAGTGTKKTLESYFSRLGETIADFELHYFGLAGDLIALARKGHASVAVKVAKIAEVEGMRDQKAIAIKMVKRSANIDVAARFRSLQAEARTYKHYRARVMEAIRESCKVAIEKSFEKHKDDGVAWLEDLDWIYEDLSLVESELVPKFPPDWKVRSFFVGGEIWEARS